VNSKSALITFIIFLFYISAKTQTVIPFHLVRGYILIDAEVNKVKGKFLFDTGTPMKFWYWLNVFTPDY